MTEKLVHASRRSIEEENRVSELRVCGVPEEQYYRVAFYQRGEFLVSFYLPEDKLLTGLLSKLQGLLQWSDFVVSQVRLPIEFVEDLPDSEVILREMAS